MTTPLTAIGPFSYQLWDTPFQQDFPVSLRQWTQTLTTFNPPPLLSGPLPSYDWPPGPPPAPIQQTWTWKYNQNLIGKDKMLTGKQVYDLPPRAEDPFPRTLRSWAWSYNRELIGKDKRNPGQQFTDRPTLEFREFRSWISTLPVSVLAPKFFTGLPSSDWNPPPPLPPPALTWTQNPQTLRQTISLPPGNQFFDLSPRDYPERYRTWTWNYNLNLIGRDAMIVGDQVTDLPPRDHPERYRTYTWSYNLNLVGKDAMIVGDQVTDLPPRPYQRPSNLDTWTWQYGLNLIGQDRMIVGDQFTDRPPTVTWYQTWTVNLLTSTLSITPAPFNQDDWPLPRAPQPIPQSWTWNYNLNLIGKDALPVGEIVYDLAPRGYPPLNPSWTWNYNVNLIGQDAMLVGDQITDLWPRAPQRPSNLDTWLWQYNLNLIGKDRVPGKIITDLPPRDYPERYRSWTWQYILELIGQDAMTVGDQFTERPPTISWLLGFTQNLLQSTLAPVTTKPFLQTDWPLTPAPQPASPSWTWNYNVNLIGQDAMTVGDQVTDLPPRPHHRQPDLTSWTWSYNRNLIGKDQLPVGEIVTALAPVGPQQPERTWISAAVAFLQVQQAPFAQFDWPNPRAPLRASSLDTWIDQTKLLLIPPAPFRQNDWPVPPPLTQPDRGFSAKYNPNLVAQDVFPPGERFTDLSPVGYSYPPDLRSFLVSPAVPPVPPPPPTTEFHSMPFFATPGQLKSW